MLKICYLYNQETSVEVSAQWASKVLILGLNPGQFFTFFFRANATFRMLICCIEFILAGNPGQPGSGDPFGGDYGEEFTHGFNTQNYQKLQASLGTQSKNTHTIKRQTQLNPYPSMHPSVPTSNFYR